MPGILHDAAWWSRLPDVIRYGDPLGSCYENYDHMTHYDILMTYADRVLLIVSDRALPRSLLIHVLLEQFPGGAAAIYKH